MPKRELVAHKIQHRPGEGHLLDVTVISADAAAGTMTIGLNASSLPVPERRFSCDAVQVTSSAGGARLLLAQRQPVGDGLLSMVVINFATEPVTQFLQSIHEEFLKQAVAFVGARKVAVAASVFSENAQQSVVLTSSYILAGHSGFSACMDFYNASPFSIQHLAVVRKLALEPVVRVNLSTGLLIALIDGLRAAAGEWGWDLLG